MRKAASTQRRSGWLLKAGAAGCVLLVLLTGLLLLPSVQMRVLDLVDASLDGISIDADTIALGLGGGRLQQLSVAGPGFSLRAEVVELTVDLKASLSALKLVVDELRIGDAQIHLWAAPPEEAPPAADTDEPFRGLAPILRWPRRLSVRAAAAEGGLLWENGTQQQQLSGPWRLALSQVAAGASPRLQAQAQFEARRGEEVLGAVRAALEASAAIAATGSVSRADAELELLPASRHDDASPLRVTARLQLDPQAESARVQLINPHQRPVAELQADYRPDGNTAELRWTADFHSGLIRQFAAAGGDSVLDIRTSGQAGIDLGRNAAQLAAGLEASGRGWEWVDPHLAEMGGFAAQIDIEALGWARNWTAQKLLATVTTEQQHEALRLELHQPTTIDFGSWQLVPEHWGEPAVSLSATELPLRWLRGFDPAGVFTGGALSGSLRLTPLSEGHTRIDAPAPIRVSDLHLQSRDGTPLPRFEIGLQPSAELHEGTLLATVEPLTISSDRGLQLDFRGQTATTVATWPEIEFIGVVKLHAPFIEQRAQEIDQVRGQARATLDLGELTLSIETAGLDAVDLNQQPLASLQIEGDSPLKIALTSRSVDWDDFQPQRLRLRFTGLPIAWLSPFLPEIDLAAGAVYGELVAEARRDRGFELAAVRPFEIRGVVPFYRGSRFARNLTFQLAPSVRLSNAGGTVKLGDMLLRSRRGDRLGGSLTLAWASNPPTQLAMDLELEGLFPSLTARIGQLGEMRWTQRGSIDLTSRQMRIDDLALTLDDAAGTRFIAARSLQPLRIDSEPLGFSADDGSAHVLAVTLTPLELQSLLPRVLGLDVEGVLPKGVFYGRVDAQRRLVLSADTPLVFQDVTLRWEGSTLVEKVDLGLRYEVAYSADGLEARSIEMAAADRHGEPLAEVTLKAVAPLTQQRPLLSLDLDLRSPLSTLSRQPLLAGTEPLDAGVLTARLSTLRETDRQLRGKMQVSNARARRLGPLPDLDASVEIDAAPGKGMTVAVPLQMTSPRGTSDLAFQGTAARVGARYRFEAGIAGALLIVPDLRQWRAWLLGSGAAEAAARPDAARPNAARPPRTALQQLRQRRDDTPFWSDRLLGHAGLRLARLQLAHNTVEDVRGEVQLLPDRLALYGVHATLGEGRLRSSGNIDYHGDRPAPYDLTYRLRIDELQIADLLQPLSPSEPPVAEGLFALTTNLRGQGRNGLDLALGTFGEIELSGRRGIFRGLAGRGAAASKAAKVVGVLTLSRQLRAIGRLLDDLDELRFSQLNVALRRDSPRQLRLEDVSLIAPRLRLAGHGSITAEPGLPLALSPMEASLDLAARGDMSILLDGMGLLEADADREGFRLMTRSLTVGGSLAEPDTSALWNTLDEAAANARGSFGLGLRAINRKLKANR